MTAYAPRSFECVGFQGGGTMDSASSRRVLQGLVAAFMMVVTAFAVAALGPVGPAAAQPTVPGVSQQGTTISYQYSDFFNVPYGEFWDYRFVKYGDLPVNAQCFSA